MTEPHPSFSRLQRGILISVAVACLVIAWLASSWRPLWYDELYTFHVAREPSLLATLRALLNGADTNPPLDYLLRHVSMTLLGETPAAFRLPSEGRWVGNSYDGPMISGFAALARSREQALTTIDRLIHGGSDGTPARTPTSGSSSAPRATRARRATTSATGTA